MGKREETNIQCRSCNARSIATVELEKYLINKFNLQAIKIDGPPEKYLCIVRFTRRNHGQYITVCIKPGERADEDVDGCLAKLKPKKISEVNGIFYLY